MIFHSQFMFKLSAICCNTCTEMRTPLLDWRINDTLIKFVLHLHDALSQFLNTTDFRSVNKLLHNTRVFRLFVFFSIFRKFRALTSIMLSTARTVRLRPLPGRLAAGPLVSSFLIISLIRLTTIPFERTLYKKYLSAILFVLPFNFFGNLFLFTERHFYKQLSASEKYARFRLIIKIE